jgi:hypothetical protein
LVAFNFQLQYSLGRDETSMTKAALRIGLMVPINNTKGNRMAGVPYSRASVCTPGRMIGIAGLRPEELQD